MNIRPSALLGAAAIAAALASAPARADTPASPYPYDRETADGRHVLRMYPRYGVSDSPLRSGLYPRGGGEPLWTVDWYAFGVHLSPDGRYLVREGPWASSFDDLAIAFYDRGRLMAAYSVGELVPDPESVWHSVSHFMWRRALEFDAQRLSVTVPTFDRVYRFDAATGAMLAGATRVAPRTHARILGVDGRWVEVDGLANCNGAIAMVLDLPHRGAPFVVGMTGAAATATGGTGASEMVAIPIPVIRRVSVRVDDGAVLWKVELRDGEQHTLRVDEGLFAPCADGERAGAPRRHFAIVDVAAIEVGATRTAPMRSVAAPAAGHAKVLLAHGHVIPVDMEALDAERAAGRPVRGSMLARLESIARGRGGWETTSPALTALMERLRDAR